MILTYLGHSFFTLSLENGAVIAMDPYGEFYGYPRRLVQADACLISHHHHDHDGVECVAPEAQRVDQAGEHDIGHGAKVTGVATWHDAQGGAQRGPNVFFIVEAEGLRIGHAGDLGHVPTAEQARRIGKLDVLLLPVGGYYTIDAATAEEVRRLLRPTVTVPMHYRTAFDPQMPIASLEAYLSLAGAEDTQLPFLRLAQGDVCERPSVVTLAIEG